MLSYFAKALCCLISVVVLLFPNKLNGVNSSNLVNSNLLITDYKWIMGKGLYGGNPINIVIPPNYPNNHFSLLATQTAVYKAVDFPPKWEKIDTLPANFRVSSFTAHLDLVSNNHTLVISGYGNENFLVSKDGGNTWRSKNINAICSSIQFSPTFNIVLAACGSQLYRSTDDGESWENVNNTYGSFVDIDYSSAYAIDKTVVITSTNGIFKSSQEGEKSSWTTVNSDSGFTSIALSPNFSIDQTIFGIREGEIYKVENNLVEVISSPVLGSSSTYVSPFPDYLSTKKLLACTTYGAFTTTNNGENWIPIEDLDTPCNEIIWSKSFISDKVAVVLEKGPGILMTQNNGLTWTRMSDGLLETNVTGFDRTRANNQNLVFSASDSGLFVSSNAGMDWNLVGINIPHPRIWSVAVSPNFAKDKTIIVGTKGNGVYTSNDGGLTWTNKGPVEKYSTIVNDIAISPNYENDRTVFLATNLGTFRSIDGTKTWSKVQGLSAANQIEISPNYLSDSTIVAATLNGVIISTDKGTTFDYSNQGLPVTNEPYADEVNTIRFSPSFMSDKTLLVGTSAAGLYKSIDKGISWRPSYNGLVHPIIKDIVSQIYENRITYYATASLSTQNIFGLYMSENGGESWNLLPSPNEIVKINKMISLNEPGSILIGTEGESVWRFTTVKRTFLPTIFK